MHRLIDGQHVRGGIVPWNVAQTVERHHGGGSASFARHAGARVIHEDPAHDFRCNPEELRAVLPGNALLIDEPEVQLVDESRGYQRVLPPFAPQMPGGDATQLGIDQREQRVSRRRVALRPAEQQASDVLCRRQRLGQRSP